MIDNFYAAVDNITKLLVPVTGILGFSTYIYGFTWEDPQADIAALDLHSGDNIMVITSAGDNALAYAAHTNGLTIHCVDMNPCQNHLLELKLAALTVVTKLLGVSKDLEQIAGASSLTDQIKIWCSRVSHNLLSSTSIHILDNPLAIWRLMGVPSNQLKMLHNEGSMSQYVPIVDTLQKIQPGELSKAVIMDHMDWCTPDEADAEINALKIALKQGGFVLWRSAARIPWYVANFKALDFKVEAIAVRQPNTQTALDRVNMYASFYRATKL
ncbi:hypothetical protein IW147_003895 [Coemansia sp. RSA 720]|nr:hypothetical protein IW147_003895 [Coemansia sp. RSA 720]